MESEIDKQNLDSLKTVLKILVEYATKEEIEIITEILEQPSDAPLDPSPDARLNKIIADRHFFSFRNLALGLFIAAVSTCLFFRTSFGRVLSSVTSSTNRATSSPNVSAISSLGTSQSSIASWSKAAITRLVSLPAKRNEATMKLTLNHTLALISLVLSLASSAVAAWGFCSQPSAPFCATQYGTFDDTYDFDLCRREMQAYKSDVEDFLSCQRNENERAVQEYNDAVESFNRRARG
jgi:hypothetical protein